MGFISQLFGGGDQPSPPPPPPTPASPPTLANPEVTGAAGAARARAAAAFGSGYGGTLLTGPSGLDTPAPTTPVKLLGGAQ